MKQICAHADTMGEAVTALESDENGDFFRHVVSERTRAHERLAEPMPFDGSFAEMVKGRIEGHHHPENLRSKDRPASARSIYAVY